MGAPRPRRPAMASSTKAIRTDANRRKGGRHPDGAHLLTGGLLRCSCGAAMIPRRARPGIERERYQCASRVAGGACSQPSIRRELIDGPFLQHLLDGYIDVEATVKRIEERTASALVAARQALDEAQRELQQCDARLTRVQRGWQDDVIDDAEYTRQRIELLAEQEAARAAQERAQEHVQQVEHAGPVGDAEQVLLDYLATIKEAVTAGVDAAPDLPALRNVIGQLFARVELIRSGEFGTDANITERFINCELPPPTVDDGGYWLLPTLRWSAVDTDTFKPIGQEMPVLWSGQYPHGFFCRYCWW
jgi:Recombinase zinc beta ribbon domain